MNHTAINGPVEPDTPTDQLQQLIHGALEAAYDSGRAAARATYDHRSNLGRLADIASERKATAEGTEQRMWATFYDVVASEPGAVQ